MHSKRQRQPWTCVLPLYRPGFASQDNSPAESEGGLSATPSAHSSPAGLVRISKQQRPCLCPCLQSWRAGLSCCEACRRYRGLVHTSALPARCSLLKPEPSCCHSPPAAARPQATSRLRASSSSLPRSGSPAGTPQRQADGAEGQVVYELGRDTGGRTVSVPHGTTTGVKRSLGGDIEVEAKGQHVPAGGLNTAATGAAGHGAIGGGGGWAVGGSGGMDGGGDGPAQESPAGMVFGNLGSAMEGLQLTPAGFGGFATTGQGQGVASFGQHQHGGATPAVAAAGSAAAGGTGLGGPAGSSRQAAAGGRGHPTPLHISRVSVADLLHGPGIESGGSARQLTSHTLSQRDQASVSRLAASMHGGGMPGVSPADIKAALSGQCMHQVPPPLCVVWACMRAWLYGLQQQADLTAAHGKAVASQMIDRARLCCARNLASSAHAHACKTAR